MHTRPPTPRCLAATRRGARPFALGLLALSLLACASLSRTPTGARPADFKLVVFVDTASDRNSQYIVEPDRAFRAALGRDVTGDFYPPTTATLTPAQMDHLWSLARPLLDTAPNAPRSIDLVLVHITLTVDGRVHRWVTTPDAPAVSDLLAELLALRGG